MPAHPLAVSPPATTSRLFITRCRARCSQPGFEAAAWFHLHPYPASASPPVPAARASSSGDTRPEHWRIRLHTSQNEAGLLPRSLVAPSAESPAFHFTCKEPQQQRWPLRGIQVPARVSHSPTQHWAHPSPPPAWVCYLLQLMAWKPCHPRPLQQEQSSQDLLRTPAKPPLTGICVKSCIYCMTLKAPDPAAWGLGWQCQPSVPGSICSSPKVPGHSPGPDQSAPCTDSSNVTSTGKDQAPRLILCGTPDPGPAGSFLLTLSTFSSPQPHHMGSSHSFLIACRSPEQITLVCTSFLSSWPEPEQQ